MTDTPQQCPKCQGRMEQGYILDNTYGSRSVTQWVKGAPIRSFWVGTSLPDEALVPVGTFRCTACGYLEMYARPEFEAR